MKELVGYLLHHPALLVLASVLVVGAAVGAAQYLQTDWDFLDDGAAPAPSPTSKPDAAFYVDETGVIEGAGGDGVPDIIVGASPPLPGSGLPEAVEPQKVGPVADVLYAGAAMYCEGGKPYVNLQASFGSNEKWLKGDYGKSWSTEGDMQCTFVSYDEQTFTALFNCGGAPDSMGLFAFTGKPPIGIYFASCEGGSAEGGSEDPTRREPDCGDRKC